MTVRRWLRPQTARPASHRIPPGLTVYAVGDIHGRADCLAAMQAKIAEDAAPRRDNRIVELYLGDYIDRGPQSRAVIEALLEPPRTAHERICLRGNHEAMLLANLSDPGAIPHWLQCGGAATLRSYGVPLGLEASALDFAQLRAGLADALPDAHRGFLEALRPLYEIGDYLFVHAGIRPGVPLDAQDPDDLLWIREAFLASPAEHGKRIVHGHTPVAEPELLPNRVNLDTGAFSTGRLTCAVLEGTGLRIIQTD